MPRRQPVAELESYTQCLASKITLVEKMVETMQQWDEQPWAQHSQTPKRTAWYINHGAHAIYALTRPCLGLRPDFFADATSLLADMRASREKLNDQGMELRLDHKDGQLKSTRLEKFLGCKLHIIASFVSRNTRLCSTVAMSLRLIPQQHRSL